MGTAGIMLTLLGVAATIAVIAWWLIRDARKATEAWGIAAERLAAQFDPKAGPWHRRRRVIRAAIDGVNVHIDHYDRSTGHSATVFTQSRADAPGTGKLRLRVSPKKTLFGFDRSGDSRDVETGDAAFDEAFVVKANDADLARAWLSEEVRAAMTRAERYRFVIEDGEVEATRATLEDDSERLQAVAEATATIARRGAQIREGWQRFADGQQGAMHAGLRIEVDDAPVPMRIDTEGIDRGEHTYTRVVSRIVGGKGERYAIAAEADAIAIDELEEVGAAELEAYAVRSSEPERTARRLDAKVRDAVTTLGPVKITSDGETVTVLLPGVADESQLEQAAALAAELADPTEARYR